METKAVHESFFDPKMKRKQKKKFFFSAFRFQYNLLKGEEGERRKRKDSKAN